MADIAVRPARPGDGAALAQIHADMGAYYVTLAPGHFQQPQTEGLAEALDAEARTLAEDHVHLVAEVAGEVVGALFARLLAGDPDAEHQITPDSGEVRLRIEYVATAESHRRSGVGTRLVQEAETWGRARGATVAETWTYRDSPLSAPFWTERMAYEERSVNLRKSLL
jgi:GNAT superfamily N-acetyltransferase